MKLLFLYPMWTSAYKGITGYFARKSGGVYPPMNLALLGAIAEQKGHQVEIIDAEVERIPQHELVGIAREKNPDFICLTGMSPFFHLSLSLAKSLKQENLRAPICIGGPHITIVEEAGFDAAFDFGFLGDAEESWSLFLDAVSADLGFEHIPGLMYRHEGKVLKNSRRPTDKNLDNFPIAARHLLPVEKYRLGTLRGRLNFTTIQTVRGCPWKCIFCASDELDTTRISKRSVASVVDELEHVVNKFGIKHFVFLDDVLTLSRKRTLELCEEITKRKLDITFEGATRANLVTEELVSALKTAGLIRLSFGLETVDEDMRKTMKKQVPLEAYREANQITNQYGIEALNSVMIGLPGETEETVRKTLDFLRTARDVKQVNFAIAIPYPGTEFHKIAVNGEQGVELLSKELSEYRRYGSAVTRINTLGPEDLLRLQNEGFVSVYSRYWRWWSVVRKSGVLGLVLTFFRLFNVMRARAANKQVQVDRHPSLE